MRDSKRILTRLAIVWLLAAGPGVCAWADQRSEPMADQTCAPIDVGSRKQLFIDHRFIESSEGVALKPHPAVKADLVLEPASPDERYTMWISSVVEADGRYHMYYTSRFEGTAQNGDTSIYTAMRLAISEDGRCWRRMRVRRFDIGQGTLNNIVMVGAWGTVFVDPSATEGYRFWLLGHLVNNPYWAETRFVPPKPADPAERRNKLYLCRSKDGIHWETVKEPVFPFSGDTRNQALFDPRIGKYVCYLRARPGGHGSRAVARGQSDHLLGPWPFTPDPALDRRPPSQRGWLMTELPLVMQADESDPPLFGIYTPNVNIYPWAADADIAFPDEYRRRDGLNSYGRDERGKPANEGPVAPGLSVSRDGTNWHRFHTSYVPLGRIGQIDGGTIYMGVGMIRQDDEIWQYCTVSPHTHHGYGLSLPGTDGGIRRVVQRLDGFVSVDADHEGGTFRTPLLVFRGDRLELNVDGGVRGEVWVEIQDAHGQPIPGYTMDDAVSVDLNGVREEVWWKQGPDVSELAGQAVRLVFRLRSASLYAFQFVPK